MATTTSLSVSNGHVDSLIEYVLDTKPYHTKLSEIIEEFLFEETITVNVETAEDLDALVAMGLDYTQSANVDTLDVWANTSVRPASSLSADKTIMSDGSRTTFSVPSVTSKLFSQSGRESFTISSTTDFDERYFISPVRFDGPGIPSVKKNGTPLTESVDYHICHGAYSFGTSGTDWIPGNSETANSGALAYDEINTSYGRIRDISVDPSVTDYEEWTLTWVDSSSHLTVVGSESGSIGTATYGVPFVHSKLNFLFTHSPSEDSDPGLPPIEDGDTFVLTPSPKIVVHEDAVDEIWTLIKVNPVAVSDTPTFTPAGAGATPYLSIYTQSLERTPQTTFTITFTSPTAYTLSSSTSLIGYPKTGLDPNYSFKDEYVHFTINRNGRTFITGDEFEFDVENRKTNYLVHGTVSGWETNAKIGEWYWNGKIGFKIPQLEYYAFIDGDTSQFFSVETILDVHSVARPSVYTVIARPPIGDLETSTATVEHNIWGYRQGMEIGEIWADEYCSFRLPESVEEGTRIMVYLTPLRLQAFEGGYDDMPYESNAYDMTTGDYLAPYDLMTEYFPLYKLNNTVVIPDLSTNDVIIIDKVESDRVHLRIGEPETGTLENITLHDELGDTDGWIPIEFRYLNDEGNECIFPDYAQTIQAYAASSPETPIFTIEQPEGEAAVLEFDEEFFEEFLPSSTVYTIRFHQQSSYAQTISIKISEDLQIIDTLTGGLGLAMGESLGI